MVAGVVKWPNDSEGNARTSVPWIIAGFIMLPLSIGAMVLMSNSGVRQVATVEQRARPVRKQAQPAAPISKDDDWWKKGSPL